jgi:ribosomal protein S18 acetylase RimI-like enzyme
VTAADPLVRPGTPADATSAARLHVERITDGFLSFLGPAFLTRLYRRIVASPGAFLVVAVADGRTVGFVAGCDDVGRLYRRFLVRDGVPAALGAAGRLLSGWRRALETLRHGGGAGTGAGVELLAIAVDPAAEGAGVGARLVGAFLDRVRADGGDRAYVVVAEGNDRAVRLYGRAGFVRSDRFELHAGTPSLVLQWTAPGTRP